ncbi:MAG TPA: M3 family metallopeptidase [Caldimonas sp.]|jgi:thimet oligopeptidase|nr:M3 family metallopeptidase [Caldimonas sp.]
MKFSLPFVLGAGVIGAAASAATSLPGPAFPRFASASALTAACDAALGDADRRVKALEKHAADARWLAAWDDLNASVEDASAPIGLLENVHPDKAIREAAQACSQRWSEFASSLGQNETLYRALVAVKPRDAIEREFVKFAREGFEDAGVGLAPGDRVHAKQLSDRIADLDKQFGARIRDANVRIAVAVEDLAGVPEEVWKTKPRDDAGRVLLGLDYPTLNPVAGRAEKASTRERFWRAKQNEGGDANLALLGELARLRRDYAHLFGVKTFADFQLRRRMVENAETTERFLNDVRSAVQARELRDLDEMRDAKARHLGTPAAATRLERWDLAFYTERLRRERYSVDQEAFREYFPAEESLRFVMRVAERMLGIRYTSVPVALWHEDARAYAVSDAKSGKPLATLYIDPYPREGKYNHAAVWPLRSAATRIGRTAQAALVVNNDRKGLTLDELETLLHELGHALHDNLSATRNAQQSSSNVQLDFVEAPSQMLEDWVYDKKVLKLFAEVCPTCRPVPDEMIDKARVARDFGKGMRTARQLLFASYDLALYTADVPEPMALWSRMEGATPLGHVADTRFPAGFAHIAGGYAAGYYGYLWSLVVAHDLRTAFKDDRLDPVVGARYRRMVLAQGRQLPPRELVREFLGRETNSKAFFDDLAR